MITTTNHEEIRRWAESHGGQPEIIDDPEAGADQPMLKLNFPQTADENFLSEHTQEKSVSWPEFFQKFEEMALAFIYDENYESGDFSNAYKFIKRDHLDEND